MIDPVLHSRHEGGRRLGVLVWHPPAPLRVASTTALGGGLGERAWFVNAQVADDYARHDVEAHLGEVAGAVGLPVAAPGVGMLTAVDVRHHRLAHDAGVDVVATVGLGWPTWAAAPADAGEPPGAGTINLWIGVPARLSDAALVNAVTTATEAKAQALADLGVAATGTASDAVCVACVPAGPAEPFGGPRSRWGAAVARAVHAAVLAGARADLRWRRAGERLA